MRNSEKVNKSDIIKVGKITKPFGIKGEVLVIDYAEDFEQFKQFKYFYLESKNNYNNLDVIFIDNFIVEGFRGNSNRIILKLKGVDSRDDSEMIAKKNLYVLKDDISLEEGEYLFQDLIGCSCVLAGETFGKVMSMPNHGTCDMFEIRLNSMSKQNEVKVKTSGKKNSGRFVNVPYYKELIEKVDIEEKIIYFNEDCRDYLD